jgi:CRISPR-associated endoribonuclease Cas6
MRLKQEQENALKKAKGAAGMLTTVEYTLQREAAAHLTSSSASLLQGFLMQNIDPKYGEILHRSELKPYSQYLLITPEKVTWILHTLDATAEKELVQIPAMQNLEKIYLEQKQLEIPVLAQGCTRLSMQELMQQTFFGQCPRIVRIRISTPTSFKSGGEYQIYPTIRLLFQSLIKKYDAVSESTEIYTPEILRDIEENVVVIGYRLCSTSFGVEGVKIPAFIGELTLKIGGPQQLVNLIHMLLRFGTFSGVGIKTAMGMGGFELVERKGK